MAASTWPFVISLTHPCLPFPCPARHTEVGYEATSALQCESIQVEDGNGGGLEVLRI